MRSSRLDHYRQTDVWRSRNSCANSRSSRDWSQVKTATGPKPAMLMTKSLIVSGAVFRTLNMNTSLPGPFRAAAATIVAGMGADKNVYTKTREFHLSTRCVFTHRRDFGPYRAEIEELSEAGAAFVRKRAVLNIAIDKQIILTNSCYIRVIVGLPKACRPIISKRGGFRQML